MGKWVGFGIFVSFKFWHIKGLFISLSPPFQVFIFHNELCGSECNFLHVREQRHYCFALRQTPLWSDVVMLKELTNNVDSISRCMTYNLRGSFRNQHLYCTELCMSFSFLFLKYTAVCLLPPFWVVVCICVSVCLEMTEKYYCICVCVCVDECVCVFSRYIP